MKPDIIVSWPVNSDYPLWRRFIAENRKLFNRVIVVFTYTYGYYDYSNFVIKNFDADITFVTATTPDGKTDWRNVAVNNGLNYSQSEWVWFTEQDFIPKDGFFTDVNKLVLEGCDLVAVMVADWMHPCSIFAKRSIIEKTKKDFGVKKDELDHFGIFQKDVEGMNIIMGVTEDKFEHLNGLTSNFSLISNGYKPNYEPERFKQYIEDCLSSGMKLEPTFEEVCKRYLNV